jgi:flagellar basal body rod protein FlgG
MSMAPQPSYLNLSQGNLVETGNPLNVALHGPGYFEVSTSSTQKGYTRDGRFSMDANGTLTTLEGLPVQSTTGGNIVVPPGSSEVQINSKGQVMVFNIPGQPPAIAGQIKVIDFPNPELITNVGNGMYQSPDAPVPAPNTQIVQGKLEESNVNVIREMLDSMVGMRTYEVMQKSVNMQNETLGRAVNDIGRIV